MSHLRQDSTPCSVKGLVSFVLTVPMQQPNATAARDMKGIAWSESPIPLNLSERGQKNVR